MLKHVACVVSAVVVLSACSTAPQKEPMVDPALLRLAEAADSISKSMTRLAKIESAQSDAGQLAQQYEFNLELMPEVWQRKVVLVEDYYGSIENFVLLISAMLGLDEPRVMGTQPPNPIMIGINRTERPAIEFIADAGYQAGQSALVRPMINDRKILLQYR